MTESLCMAWTTHKCSMYFKILFQPIPFILFTASTAKCSLALVLCSQASVTSAIKSFYFQDLFLMIIFPLEEMQAQQRNICITQTLRVCYHAIRALLQYLGCSKSLLVNTSAPANANYPSKALLDKP